MTITNIKQKQNKTAGMMCACKPSAGEAETGDPWGLLVKRHTPKRPCLIQQG